MIKRFSDWLSNRKHQFENFLKTGELEAVESMVDQLADPNKFPPGRTLYDTLVGWGVGTSINTHDGVFFKAGFEQSIKSSQWEADWGSQSHWLDGELNFDWLSL